VDCAVEACVWLGHAQCVGLLNACSQVCGTVPTFCRCGAMMVPARHTCCSALRMSLALLRPRPLTAAGPDNLRPAAVRATPPAGAGAATPAGADVTAAAFVPTADGRSSWSGLVGRAAAAREEGRE
jgi:hypothetical protein